MQHTLIASSARSIQSYALAGNKLRDMIGASALIDGITADNEKSLLNRIIGQIQLEENAFWFIRRQGGTLEMLFRDARKAKEFLALWSAAIPIHCPLQVDHALVEDFDGGLPDALEQAHKQLNVARNQPEPTAPSASPLALRSQRTGTPAVSFKDEEAIDCLQVRKRNHAKSGRDEFLSRILPETLQSEESDKWPLEFEEIAGDGERAYLALVHADGNNLGQLVRELSESLEKKSVPDAAEAFLKFSNAIADSTRNAVADSLKKLHEEKWGQIEGAFPFRPIVCAGDDLTVVLRAEDGLVFARTFLDCFRKQTRKHFEDLKSLGLPLPRQIEAAAGIAYVKSHFPFHLAYDLCESLCKNAKSRTGREHSAIAFHRVTTSATGEYQQVLGKEYRYGDRLLTMNPYLLEDVRCNELASLNQLDEFRSAGRKLPRGSLRQVARDATISAELAENRMERAKEVSNKQEWDAFDRAWQAISGVQESKVWISRSNPDDENQSLHVTPLLDAIELNVMENSFTADEQEETTTDS